MQESLKYSSTAKQFLSRLSEAFKDETSFQILQLTDVKMLLNPPKQNILKKMQNKIVDKQKAERQLFRILPYNQENFVQQDLAQSEYCKKAHPPQKHTKSIFSRITIHYSEKQR